MAFLMVDDMGGAITTEPDNPIQTVFIFQAREKEAVEKAVRMLYDEVMAMHEVDIDAPHNWFTTFKAGIARDYFPNPYGGVRIDIRTNNYIPQLYEKIKETDGLLFLIYMVYCPDENRVITNYNDGKFIPSEYGFPSDCIIGLDEGDDMFPMANEFAIPPTHQPD